jgi:hypothetical protein
MGKVPLNIIGLNLEDQFCISYDKQSLKYFSPIQQMRVAVSKHNKRSEVSISSKELWNAVVRRS